MAGFASGLRAGIDEAARKMTETQLAGDDYGGEACATTATPALDRGARTGRPAGSTRKESG